MERLTQLVDRLFPNFCVEATQVADVKMLIHPTEGRVLLCVKPISGEPAFFNMTISGRAFGPELIHEDDFKRLQLLMRELGVERCAYVLHSVDKESFVHQFTFPLDRHYIRWISSE